MHTIFFNYHDLIQNKYELVRLVKLSEIPINNAINQFGFKSRSSYYLVSNQIREQGFIGLFDLRPINRKTSPIRMEMELHKNYDSDYDYLRRPKATVWDIPNKPWNNAFYGLQQKNHKLFIQVVKALAEGNGVRGISRIFDIDKNTVLQYLKKAAFQCRRVTNHFIQNIHVDELQLDEMWGFVYKKEKNLTEEEYESCLEGDQWCWIAIDTCTKVIVQYEIGKRTYNLANDLIKNFKKRTDGIPPSLIMSDAYKGYKIALLKNYGIKKYGKPCSPPDMDYAVVKKIRKKGRIEDIIIKVIFGSIKRIKQKLLKSKVSNKINVAFVERSNLSRRLFNRRLTRKTIGFSKKIQNHLWQFEIETAFHNFVRQHIGLDYITPMMSADKTDHIWSVKELLSFSV